MANQKFEFLFQIKKRIRFKTKILHILQFMQTDKDKKRQLILKAIPQRRKTSKKLKQQILQDIYYRQSSLPQKKSVQNRQLQNSLPKKIQKKQSLQNQQFTNLQAENIQSKIKQENRQSKVKTDNLRIIQRKIKSLPKYIYATNNLRVNQDCKQVQKQKQRSQDHLKYSDHSKTKVKKFSHKEQRQIHNLSQQKHRLQALEQILKKKQSKKIIKQQFLQNDNKNQHQANFQSHFQKNKDNRIANLKHAFENRKFTNLSKYKPSDEMKNNKSFGIKDHDFFFVEKNRSQSKKKIEKQVSKKAFKKSQEQDQIKIKNEMKQQKSQIKDLDLSQYFDSQIPFKDNQANVKTLEDQFNSSVEEFQKYLAFKQKNGKFNSKQEVSNSKKLHKNQLFNPEQILKQVLKKLKAIQNQTGTLSKKTLLFLGKIYFQLGQYNSSIFYLQSIFQQCDYDLSRINTFKQKEKKLKDEQKYTFYSQYFMLLTQSYKKTQNFLCSIKVMNQWQKNIVKRILFRQNSLYETQKQSFAQYKTDNRERRKRTISYHINDSFQQQKSRKYSNNGNYSYYQYSLPKSLELEQSLKLKEEKIHAGSSIKQNYRGLFRQNFLSTGKQKQKSQKKRQGLQQKQNYLSMKTLSDINLYQQGQNNEALVRQRQIERCSQKQKFMEGYLTRARIQYEIKNYYASINDYLKTLICNQFNLEAGLQLATLYYKIGRKDKSIAFLYQFLNKYTAENKNDILSINQIRYHLAVLLYKSQQFENSQKMLQIIQKQLSFQQFKSQVYFYQSLNLIKLQKLFKMENEENQRNKKKKIQQILIYLQKCIDFKSSQFYVYSAYFLKIYLLIFKIKHYYGAQYQIDRMKNSAERNRFIKQKSMHSKTQNTFIQVDFRKISTQPLNNILNLQDLTLLTSAIICILKLKLSKGLHIISYIEKKVLKNLKNYFSQNVVSIQNPTLIKNYQEDSFHSMNQTLKVLYQFKYYGFYTMRDYRKAIVYLQRIKGIDKLDEIEERSIFNESQRKKQQEETIKNTIQSQIMQENSFQTFKDQNDKINYLILQTLILIQKKQFQEGLKVLKNVQNLFHFNRSNKCSIEVNKFGINSTNQNHKNQVELVKGKKAKVADSFSVVVQYRKQQNYFHIIKSLCYILLYRQLQKSKQSHQSLKNLTSQVIKISQTQREDPVSSQFENYEQNDQILLAAEDLLSQCLICDKENFQILFLIAVIHYELKRYQSSLNYIRQAIQLSDDHMIKHYYLKANMKLLLGRYDQAIKDYSNAITVWKQLDKQKQQNKKSTIEQNSPDLLFYKSQRQRYNQRAQQKTYPVEKQKKYNEFQRNNYEANYNKSRSLSDRSEEDSSYQNQSLNEYYEEEQQMHPEIYLNRAISYLKYAYSMQCQASQKQSKVGKYQEVRETIINLKSIAAQDIKLYFQQIIKLLKSSSFISKNKKTKANSSIIQKQKQRSPQKNSQTSNNKYKYKFVQQLGQNILKKGKNLLLLLHTSEVQSLLEVSKIFANEISIRIVTDEQLLIYFYTAKQLNNCLLMMEKLIKKHYLSSNSEETQNNLNKKHGNSKYVQTQLENQPYFKSKKGKKQSRLNTNIQFNSQKYANLQEKPLKSSENASKGRNDSRLSNFSKAQDNLRNQKMIFDKKILSALKDSSSNNQDDYENALVVLLEQYENISKATSPQANKMKYQDGNIFRYSDLLFFIGVMYYLLDHFQNSIKYFEQSLEEKKHDKELFSIKNLVISSLNSSTSTDSPQKQVEKQISIQNLRSFEQIYDNRTYSKQEIQYNIGLAYLMNGQYNEAYQYLEQFEQFVDIIEQIVSQKHEQQSNDQKKTKGKLKKFKPSLQNKLSNKSLDRGSIQTKNKKQANTQDDIFDITPFPTHNRLCSIYQQKQLNERKFSLSFCLPKINLPLLNLFHEEQIQIAQKCENQNIQLSPTSFNFGIVQDTKQFNAQFLGNKSHQMQLSEYYSKKYSIQKEQIINFLQIISLKDIEMKPNAPWIKKDRQKRCIQFTDNFLSQSFDLKTQCATERKIKNPSKKQMFGRNEINQNKKCNKKLIQEKQQQQIMSFKAQKNEKLKSLKAQNNFSKQKQKNSRYQTIVHENNFQ